MKIVFEENSIILENAPWFDIEKTFDCGQCFRWEKDGDAFFGIVKNKVIKAVQSDNKISFYGISKKDYEDFFCHYLDMERDYIEINKNFMNDKILPEAMNYSQGIRLLNQEVFETIISFIISQNNNIPRIKKIINSLCQNFGKKVEFEGKEYYLFPTADDLKNVTAKDLEVIKSGFRGKYILDAVEKINSGLIDIENLKNLSYEDAKAELMKIKGVGDKVSDCVLLFSCEFVDAFPKDVWIKRILKEFYNDESIDKDYFCGYGGIAQQYLFHYARMIQLGK
ncbi:MAG: DNA glycosylase [Clostridia bacterium]|nr:DNA glycosylase [Clostridia bacterium]